MTDDYGRKGCRCWPEELDISSGADGLVTRVPGRWMPNAGCPFHGVLAGMVKPRDETGTYRVVSATPEPEECPPGVHSMFDFCQGRAVCEEGFYPDTTMTPEEAKAITEAMHDPDAPTRRLNERLRAGIEQAERGETKDRGSFVDTYSNPALIGPKDEERGVLATVRRWGRHLADAYRGRPGWH